jgi:membrane protease YdiL (CAAX protease family)
MLFARPVLAVVAQGLVATIYAARGSLHPWRAATPWLPVYGSLIDAGCLGILWWLTRREEIHLRDLIGFDRRRLGKDVLLGLALIVPSLLFILAGNFTSNFLVYGRLGMPQIFEPLPLWAALYGVIVFPLLWGITEQTTYNGYVLPRLQILFGSTGLAVAAVALVWSFQHALMPLTFDPKFMLYRLLSPLPFSIFITLVYLRLRRIVPLATAHWLMDGSDAFAGSLLPLLR